MNKTIENLSTKALLVILDGFGINPHSPKNAIESASTPFIDSLFSSYPFRLIEASGEAVGLPNGIAGNSEVGHLNIGSGKTVRLDLIRINEAIENRALEKNSKIEELCNQSKRIHLMGLLSDGQVHSHIEHIKEVIKVISSKGNHEIFFHAFLDGRDTPPKSALQYIADLQETPNFHFASLQGRSIGMDRDKRWEKIERAYKCFIGQGEIRKILPKEYVKERYDLNETDEFISPILFDSNFSMRPSDAVFFLNFRPDRARQITLALTDPKFKKFERPVTPKFFLCMTPYIDDELSLPIAFDKEKITGGLGQTLSENGTKQVRIAETEKYAHVTYFFNGGERRPFPGEEQILIPSPREVETYDQKPEMNAEKVTKRLIEEIDKNKASFFCVNYANSDMVGHTGKFEAAVKAIEALDENLETLVSHCLQKNMAIIISADHGNSDEMIDSNGNPHTAHTKAKVPFCLIHPSLKDTQVAEQKIEQPALKDIAPTILKILGIQRPESFSGRSLF